MLGGQELLEKTVADLVKAAQKSLKESLT